MSTTPKEEPKWVSDYNKFEELIKNPIPISAEVKSRMMENFKTISEMNTTQRKSAKQFILEGLTGSDPDTVWARVTSKALNFAAQEVSEKEAEIERLKNSLVGIGELNQRHIDKATVLFKEIESLKWSLGRAIIENTSLQNEIERLREGLRTLFRGSGNRLDNIEGRERHFKWESDTIKELLNAPKDKP